MKPQRAGLARGAVMGAAAVAVVAALATTSPWRGFEERAEGVLLQARGPLPWNPEVVIIAVDDASLRRLGWPVERQAYALVLNAVAAAGARAAGFDIFFTDPARDGPEGDALFAEVARQFGRAAFPAECSLERLPEPRAFPAGGPLALSRGATPARACPSLVFPHGPLGGAATLAHVLVPVSSSGNIRGQHLFIEEGEHRLPSLAIATYLLGKGLPASAVVQEPREVRIEKLRVPVNREGGVLASYRGLPTEAVIAFDEVADALRQGDVGHLPESLAGRLRGKYVLFGQTAGGIGDHGPIITGENVPLVALHAALLSDLLEGRPVREAPIGVELGLVLLSGVLAIGAALALRPWAAIAVVTLELAALVAGGWWLAGQSYLVGLVASVVAMGVGFAAALAARLSAQERERRLLRDAFGAYVDAAVLERLLEDPDRYLSLGGAKKTLTVLFSDIKGYTSLSNRLPPEEILTLLRQYLEAMTTLIRRHEGRVDKIMGDGILAVFGDPIPNADHAHSAVEAGLAMQAEVGRLERRWSQEGKSGLQIRIGIATGEVFVGNIGSPNAKIEYTVLGATVNLASRLEGKAPPGAVLVAEETRAACQEHFTFQAMPGLTLKGFSETYRAYLVLGPPDTQDLRRTTPRLRSKAPVLIRTARESDSGWVDNVSAGGLHVSTSLQLAIGAEVELELAPVPQLTGDLSAVVVRGVVQHVGPSSDGLPGFGMAVQQADASSEAVLHHFAALYLDAASFQPGERLHLDTGGTFRVEVEGGRVRLVREA